MDIALYFGSPLYSSATSFQQSLSKDAGVRLLYSKIAELRKNIPATVRHTRKSPQRSDSVGWDDAGAEEEDQPSDLPAQKHVEVDDDDDVQDESPEAVESVNGSSEKKVPMKPSQKVTPKKLFKSPGKKESPKAKLFEPQRQEGPKVQSGPQVSQQSKRKVQQAKRKVTLPESQKALPTRVHPVD